MGIFETIFWVDADENAGIGPEGLSLTGADLSRLHRFHRIEDQKRFLVGRKAIHSLLAHFAVGPSQWFIDQSTGRPTALPVPGLGAFDFNIAHDGLLVAGAATTRGRVGIDVMRAEVREPSTFFTEFLPSLSEALTAGELQAIQGSSSPVDLLFAIWTIKEAFVKASGDGIGFGLKRIECQAEADLPLEHNQSFTPTVRVDKQPVDRDRIIFTTTSLMKREADNQMHRYFKTTCEILI
jgi:phosphopantetheinyl transferase